MLAPIALFTYKRLLHTRRSIEQLMQNKFADESDLYIFSDGYKIYKNEKSKTEEERKKVIELRNYLKTITGFKSVTIIEREENLGLANSIISGVTEIIDTYGKIIVLEDDILTSPYFLQFMNDGLDYYQNQDTVVSIHGYLEPLKYVCPETFFIKGANCWGWATWKRGWRIFEEDGGKLLREIKKRKMEKKFNFNNSVPYVQMLEDQVNGKSDSWAIRWYASAFLADKLTLYPGLSLVYNIGFDAEATHCQNEDEKHKYNTELSTKPIKVGGIEIQENTTVYNEMGKYYRHYSQKSFFRKIKEILHQIT
jgi:hypothetical protein